MAGGVGGVPVTAGEGPVGVDGDEPPHEHNARSADPITSEGIARIGIPVRNRSEKTTLVGRKGLSSPQPSHARHCQTMCFVTDRLSVEGNLGRENPCLRFFRASDKERHGADAGSQGAWRRELEAWDTAMVRAPSMPVNPTNVALQGLRVDVYL